MILKIIIPILLLQGTCLAFDKIDTRHTLQQAIMKSNKDYNDKKRSEFLAENERLDNWGNRDNNAILIDEASAIEKSDFREPAKGQDQELEVSLGE